MDLKPSTEDTQLSDKTTVDHVVADQVTTVIAARRLQGMVVYGSAGEKVGNIEDLMIDMVSGKIAYAVLAFGGFLGIGERHHPLPWPILTFDTSKGGYVVELNEVILKDAPSFRSSDDVSWADEGWGRRVHDYYKANPYWLSGKTSELI